jgi:dihydrofolate reductase
LRTLASFIISLDGFHEGPEGEFDWPIVDEEFRGFAIRQLDDADTLGFGRATYEHMAAYWPTDQAQANDSEITPRMNNMPKLVFRPLLKRPRGQGPPSLVAKRPSASPRSRPPKAARYL